MRFLNMCLVVFAVSASGHAQTPKDLKAYLKEGAKVLEDAKINIARAQITVGRIEMAIKEQSVSKKTIAEVIFMNTLLAIDRFLASSLASDIERELAQSKGGVTSQEATSARKLVQQLKGVETVCTQLMQTIGRQKERIEDILRRKKVMARSNKAPSLFTSIF